VGKILFHALDGAYLCSNNETVLFNRDYEPIARIKDGKASLANPSEWIKFEHQEHYFDDSCPPWRNAKSFENCVKILHDLGLWK
jgi:hypothetical protein